MSRYSHNMAVQVAELKQQLGVDVCSLYQSSNQDECLQLVATSGLNERAIGARLSWQQGLTGKVARTRAPVVARDIHSHADYFHVEGSGEESFKSYMGIPLQDSTGFHGVLVVQTREAKTFFHKDIKALHEYGRALVALLLSPDETALSA